MANVLPAGVTTTTTRCPSAALAETVIVAVSDVPFESTVMLDAVIVESTAPAVVRKESELAPPRFAPLIEMVKLVPFDADVGESDWMSGPVVSETAGLCGDPEVTASLRRIETGEASGAPMSVGDKRLTDTWATAGATESVPGRRTEIVATGAVSLIPVWCSTDTELAITTCARDGFRIAT